MMISSSPYENHYLSHLSSIQYGNTNPFINSQLNELINLNQFNNISFNINIQNTCENDAASIDLSSNSCTLYSICSNENNDPMHLTNKKQRKRPIFKPHNKWSTKEDKLLRELVEEYGENDWIHLAKRMEGRNSRQCRERWKYYLDPTLKCGEWSQEEDELIFSKHQEFGPKWVTISKYFKNRTDAMIKNRYNFLIRKGQKKFRKYLQDICNNKNKSNLNKNSISLFSSNCEQNEENPKSHQDEPIQDELFIEFDDSIDNDLNFSNFSDPFNLFSGSEDYFI